MNYTDKTKEEIINELLELHQSFNAIREQYEKELSLLRLAEEKVSRSEDKFRKAFMTSPDSVNINRLSDGMFISINEGFTRIMGYTEEVVIGKTSLELNIWADPELRNNLVKALQEKGRVENFEGIFRRKDGSTVTGLMSASLIDLDGVPHILNITRDITESKKAEEALKHSEERFRSVAESASDAIITTDSNENIIGWNRGAEKAFGYTEAEITGQSLNLLIHEDYRDRQFRLIELLKMGGGKYMTGKTVEFGGLKKNGIVFPVELSFSEWKTSEGQFFTGIIRDITDRKRTELENQILYEISQGVTATSNLDELLKLIHHSLAKVVYADNCFVALYNHKTELFSFPYFVDKIDPIPMPTAMGKSCSAYVFRTVKPLLLTQKIFDKLLEQNEVELVGSNAPSWVGIPLQTPSGRIGVLVLQHYEKEDVYTDRDMKFLISIGNQVAISIERKKAEEEIQLKNELLQAINAEKDKFFSILAHDLRGPMSAFVAATQILTEDIMNMTLEDIREITVSMKTDATNIYKLLENLLEWSRLKRGVMEFNPVRLNVLNTINTGVEAVSVSVRKKNIILEVTIAERLEITADKHMFETIIRNLVSNSVKFTPYGGKVIISADSDQQNTEIKISDTGIGMSQELLAKLFHLNERTNRPGTDGEPSTGLGLLLCKEFIEKHGGKIWVDSETGLGSVFSFTIPVAVGQ